LRVAIVVRDPAMYTRLMQREVVLWAGMAAASLSSGCSITTLDAPHGAAPGASEPWRRECRKVPGALAVDASLTFSGGLIAWQATDPEMFGGEPDRGLDPVEKVLGYTVLGAAGASLLYGAYVGLRCGSGERSARPEYQIQTASTPAPSGFPDNVLQYQFGASVAQVQELCARNGAVFATSDGNASCRSPTASLARPDVHFEFRFGQLSQVSLFYPTTAEQLRGAYEHVFGQARRYYGSPRVGPAPWSASCTGSTLPQCLQSGDKPGRSVWSWTLGEVELVPVLADQNTFVELRYTRYDHSGE
jgi:hypothetical protein